MKHQSVRLLLEAICWVHILWPFQRMAVCTAGGPGRWSIGYAGLRHPKIGLSGWGYGPACGLGSTANVSTPTLVTKFLGTGAGKAFPTVGKLFPV